MATPQPEVEIPAQVDTLSGVVGGVADRRLIQLLHSTLLVLKFSRHLKAPESENLTSLASDIESMVTRLGAPATETLLPFPD